MDKVSKTLNDLYKIIEREFNRNNIEHAMEGIAAWAEISYEWNQYYTNDEIEDICRKIASTFHQRLLPYEPNSKVILYYDTFGFDIRGLSLIYLKALTDLEYKVVYVTRENKRNDQTVLHELLKNKPVDWEYICFENKYSKQIDRLIEIVIKYKPCSVFMYSHPYDIAGNIVFRNKLPGVMRYKINLTDHAFWLGVKSFDYCIEFRNYGYTISHECRKISKKELLKLPYYPYIDDNIELGNLPFDSNKRFVFSGGSLYKTFGEGNKYYEIVEHILNYNQEILFLYAGTGDDSQFKILIDKYPNRVFLIPERKDFFNIIKKSLFYLNTYPVIGAQMTQYSAMAGKVPVTLRHNTASDGILIDQEKLNIEFDSVEECECEIDKLLSDNEYLEYRQRQIAKSVITEEEFKKALLSIIKNNKSPYMFSDINLAIEAISNECKYRINDKAIIDAIAKKRHTFLIRYYPIAFVKRFTGIGYSR